MNISGKATEAGTQRMAQRHSQHAYVPFGSIGWQVSAVGFGGYRLQLDVGEHEQALRFALQQGINLIDTSSTDMDGAAERLLHLPRAVSQHLCHSPMSSKKGRSRGQVQAMLAGFLPELCPTSLMNNKPRR